jgi:hypothetical protein
VDAGVILHGDPTTRLDAEGTAAGSQQLRQDLDLEAVAVNDDVDFAPVFPVLRLGVGVSF